MEIGKLPNDILNQLILKPINSGNKRREEVIKGPSIGEDCAMLSFGGDYVLASTDPITATESDMGKLLATVCTNDIAACGGTPVALLVTMLIPPTATEEKISEIVEELKQQAERFDIDIIGGHTEVTDSVNRIVLSGTILGRLESKSYIGTGGAAAGDKIIMTKFAGLEGTSILAKDNADKLRAKLGDKFVERAIACGDMLSVLEDAKIAREFSPGTMHDITEGGVFGACSEAASGAGLGFLLDLKSIPVKDETRVICEIFNISPYELIGSGALLITTQRADEMLAAFEKAGLPAALIGEVIEGESAIINFDGERMPLSAPGADAIYSAEMAHPVIFVCTGNTCRSPMAEGFAKKMSTDAGVGGYKFISRGVYADEGGRVSQNSVAAMKNRGIDISSHKPKSLTIDDVEKAEYLFVMTKGHKDLILRSYPNAAAKTFTLMEFAGTGGADISDPFGQNLSAYEECAAEIEGGVAGIMKKL